MPDHVLLIGFGGPREPDEIMPFLKTVASGRRIPEARLQEVHHHYEVIGGSSPYNEHTFRLAKALEEELRARGRPMPVYAGMRNWHPFLPDVLKEIQRAGSREGAAVILSTFRSPASCFRYKENLRDALIETRAELSYRFAAPWYSDPAFLAAQAAEVSETLKKRQWSVEDTEIIFTAHSIPAAMAEECPHCSYIREFEETSRSIARLLNCKNWGMAYQSRSGSPRDPWLEPDILEVISAKSRAGARRLLAVPIGFLCDNAEVLYDLDREAAGHAATEGIEFARSSTVQDAPGFVSLLASRVLDASDSRSAACVL